MCRSTVFFHFWLHCAPICHLYYRSKSGVGTITNFSFLVLLCFVLFPSSFYGREFRAWMSFCNTNVKNRKMFKFVHLLCSDTYCRFALKATVCCVLRSIVHWRTTSKRTSNYLRTWSSHKWIWKTERYGSPTLISYIIIFQNLLYFFWFSD